MAAGDSHADPTVEISEGVRQIREALDNLREDAVAAVKKRIDLEMALGKINTELGDLEAKAQLAERISNRELAAEIRVAAQARAKERERLQAAVNNAAQAAEKAAAAIPAVEEVLLERTRMLRARLHQPAPQQEQIREAPAALADELWSSAMAGIERLRQQADQTRMQASVAAPQPIEPASEPPSAVEKSAVQLLEELEARVGLNSSPVSELQIDANQTAATELNVLSDDAPKTRARRGVSHMGSNERVKVAIIGTGGIFRGAHLPAHVELNEKIELVAFVDPDPVAQEAVKKRYYDLLQPKVAAARERGDHDAVARLETDFENVRIFEDISQVIEMTEDRPNLLDVCTQPVLHAPLSIQGLEAGFNVMCEKPISRSWLESQRLIEVVRRTGKFYQHNENWLFDPDYYTVKKLVDAGSIGELIVMFLNQSHGGPEGNPKFWNSDFGGGGALLDNGIHAIGAAWFITGLQKTPTLVKAAQPFGMSIRMPNRIIEGRYQKVTVDDDAHILIRFEDAASNEWSTAHIEGSWSEKDSADTCYIGSTGRIDMVDEDGKRFAVVTDSNGHESRRVRVSGSNWQHWPSSFYGEIQNMVECIKVNQQSIMTAEFGADCSAIVGASYLSEKRGKKPVHLNEFKAFAQSISDKYPNDPTGADNALVDALLSAVREK